MTVLICSNPDCSKRIKAKGRELCAACWRKLTPEGRADCCKRQQAYQQRVKEHFTPGAAAVLLLLACASPGLCDVAPDRFVPDPQRPGWHGGGGYVDRNPEVALPRLDALAPPTGSLPGGSSWRGTPVGYILPLTVLGGWRGAPRGYLIGATPLTAWRGTSGSPETAGSPPAGRPVTPITPDVPVNGVPGPVGLLGIGAMFTYSRNLRRRIHQ